MNDRINNIIEKLNEVSQIDQFVKLKNTIISDLHLIADELNTCEKSDTNAFDNTSFENDLIYKGYYLNAIIDNLPGLLWLKDADSKFLIVNKEYANKTGYSDPSHLIGKTDFDLKDIEVANKYRETEIQIMKSGKPVITEEDYIDENNNKKWKRTYKAPVFDKNGVAIGTTGYSRDITNRKNAEWQITKLSQAVNQSSASIVITNLEGNIEYINPKFTQLTGYTSEEAIGKNPRILKSDKLSSDSYKLLWDTISSGKEWQGEFENIKKNGEYFWELATITPIRNSEGHICNYLAVKEDITERKRIEIEIKESEEKFRQITENIGEVFWLRNAENTEMLYVNPAFESVWGITCQSVYDNPELFEKSIYDNDRLKVAVKLEEYTKSESLKMEFRIVRPNGEIRWVQVKSSPIKNNDNIIIRHTGIAIDITNIKSTEDTLRKNKEKYRLITENSSDVIWVYNLNQNKYSYLSPAITELRGLTVEEALSEKLKDSFTKESLSAVNKLLRQNITQFFESHKNPIYSIDEVQQYHKNGSKIWVEISSRLRYNELGESEIVGVSRNIEKRKKIEFENKKNELKYKLLFENSPLGIFISNADGSIIDGNKKLLSLLGSPSLEATKKINCLSFEPLLQNGYVDAFKQCINSNKTISLEMPYKSIWGADIYLSGYLIPLEVNKGKVEMVYTIFEDITERKKAQKDLTGMTEIQNIIMKMASRYINLKYTEIETNINQSLGELSKFFNADRAIIYDYDWENNYCNNVYEWCSEGVSKHISELQNIPFDNIEELINAHIQGEIYEIDDVSKFRGKSKDLLDKLDVKSLISVPILNQDNCTGFVGFESINNIHEYTSKEKSLIFVFGQMLANLQQRMSLESKLVAEKENAQKSNKAKSEFLANMSHELRTPLNGVIGFSELLVNTSLSDMQKQYAQAINVSAKTLFGVINDILDFSKIEANKLELETVKVDMLHLLEGSIDIIKHSAEKKGLEILLNISSDLPRYAFVDPLRLTQVIANLLGNAVKFTSEGEIELKVDYTQKENQNGIISFSIRDTGIGISDSQKAILFRAFSQADSSTTRKFGGTGLGLIISDMIISKMGSKINLESKIGEGSTFYFTIETEIENENITSKQFKIKSPHCLIIDDNINSCSILSNKLSKLNIDSQICNSGIDALKILESNKNFDIIFVDYKMPLVDGIDTIGLISKKMQISTNNLPFILLHGSTEDCEFYEKSEELGIKNRLTKPIKLNELNECLINILNNENSIDTKETEEKAITNNLNQRKMRILIADDDMFNMILAKAMIKNILPDVELIEAQNGKEAVEKTILNKPDLIFMDVQMPEMDGNDATRVIRLSEKSQCERIPIIGLTAGALKEEKDKCLQSGMDDFLTKPIDSLKLEKTILNHIVATA